MCSCGTARAGRLYEFTKSNVTSAVWKHSTWSQDVAGLHSMVYGGPYLRCCTICVPYLTDTIEKILCRHHLPNIHPRNFTAFWTFVKKIGGTKWIVVVCRTQIIAPSKRQLTYDRLPNHEALSHHPGSAAIQTRSAKKLPEFSLIDQICLLEFQQTVSDLQ